MFTYYFDLPFILEKFMDYVIEKVRIYNEGGLVDPSGIIHISQNKVTVYTTAQWFKNTKNIRKLINTSRIIDGKDHAYFIGGMLDAHHHGHGHATHSFGWDEIDKADHIKQATIALGKTGLSYVMATLPSLDPGWCEFRVLDQLPFSQGKTEGEKNSPPSWTEILPGCAKAAYLLIKNKLYYVDKIFESITEISLTDDQLNKLIHLLTPLHLFANNNQKKIKMFVNDHPASRLPTAFLKAILAITGHRHPEGRLKIALQQLNSHILAETKKSTPGATKIVGVHLEGPFIAANCKGAHDGKILQHAINYDRFMDIISVAPAIKQWKVTLAPELPGAIDFLLELKKNKEQLTKNGFSIKVNIGHSNANKTKIKKALAAGAIGFTHLGNACAEECHRVGNDPRQAKSNITQYVIDNIESIPPHGVEIIADGKHLSTAFLKHITTYLGNKLLLVTDALGPTGCEDGIYRFGTLAIVKVGRAFYLANDRNKLAGSAATLAFCAENFVATACADKTITEKLDALHNATVFNSRKSSLDDETIQVLAQESAKNGVLLGPDGKLIFSLVHGEMMMRALV